MNARQGIQALRIVKPDLAIPIHYNDYDIFKEPLSEFVRAEHRAGVQDKVPPCGALEKPTNSSRGRSDSWSRRG